jgi:DNA repair exonuclease SbcCD ATPase subunit
MNTIKKITNLPFVSKIIHCADIHIRNVRRHTEYREQFRKFYSEIEKLRDANTVIVVAGDIVHTKTDMSPELIQMVSEFFVSLASLAPTIVIPGNHDANLNNLDRLDAISPIVDNLNNPNLFYLRDSGIYEIGDSIQISNMSILDSKEKYVPASKLDPNKIKIALFHGPVTNSVTSAGVNVAGVVDIGAFDDFDLVLLGDIHQFQYLNSDKTIAYPSSLIQQNFGESTENHGFLLWDLDPISSIRRPFTSTYHTLFNEYAYHTFHLDAGSISPTLDSMKGKITPKSKIRLKTTKTPESEVANMVNSIKNFFDIDDVSVIKMDSLLIGSNNTELLDSNLDVRDISTQNELIKDHLNLNLNLPVTPELLEKIYDINRKCNSIIPKDEEAVVRNLIWKPKMFEFSNMFSYGEDNVLDLSNLGGIQGLFAPNASGKSSLLDALCFCLFDTTSRAYKADQILNTKKNNFYCKFNFAIGDIDYFIEKIGTKNPNNNRVKVDINFWSINKNGIKEDLNGEQRRDTNSIIRSYIGTFEDFTLMCLSMQNNNTNFIDKSQTERKEILADFLDLGVFDKLHDTANFEYRKISAAVENVNTDNINGIIEQKTRELKSNKLQYKKIVSDIESTKKEISKCSDELVELSKSIQNIDNIDISDIQKRKIVAESLSNKILDKLRELKLKKEDIEKQLTDAMTKYKAIDVDKAVADKEKLEKFELKLSKLISDKKVLDSQIKSKTEKLEKLSEHKYDPNCEYCINNIFVKDAINTKSELVNDNETLSKLKEEIQLYKTEIDKLLYSKGLVNGITSMQIAIHGHEKNISDLNIDILKTESSVVEIETAIISLNSSIQQYENNKIAIQQNTKIDAEIVDKKKLLNELNSNLNVLNTSQLDLHSNIRILETQIEEEKANLNKVIELFEIKHNYELYLKCVDKDGVPYHLISKILPKVENEINNILSNLVEFKIILNTDGKNINAYIVYQDEYWPLELSSGMERFISAIAIRIALINISSLPKPTFLAIDEGLGVLDSSNLNQLYLLFNYIRDAFNFALIISHIDIIRDMVDNTLTIENNSGFSKIYLK